MTALRVSYAFLLRDLRVETSYKSGLLLRVASGLLSVAVFYFVATVIRRVAPASFGEYGGYFAFVIVGLGLIAFMTQGISAVAAGMRESQASGALEIMALSPTRLPVLLLSAATPAFAVGLVTLLAYLAAAAALGVDLGRANVPVALAALLLSIPSFVALSLFAIALVFVTKKGNPVAWGIRAASMLLGGVVYPLSVLPGPLEAVAKAIPLMHSVELLRRSLLLGDGFAELWSQFAVLAGLTAVVCPLGLAACALTFRMARVDGSLSR